MIRRIARTLDISVDQISNIQSKAPISETTDISQVYSLLYSFGNTHISEKMNRQIYFIEGIKRQFDELNQVLAVTGTFINSIQLFISYCKGSFFKICFSE